MAKVRVFVATKDKFGPVEMPHSEVCMFMRIAGEPMYCQFVGDDNAVQLFDLEGQLFSFPILYSEAGIYRQGNSFYYYQNIETEDPATAGPITDHERSNDETRI